MLVAVVINPVSGRRRGEGAARVALASRGLAAARLDGEVVLTSRAGDGRRLAAEAVARGCDRVVAWGGDGTVNEVASALIGTRTSLGIVPSGSGDGLARGLGLPRAAEAALAVALDPAERTIDVGRLGGRPFLNIGGVGFDARIARAFNARTRRGAWGYITGAVSTVWSYRSQTYRIDIGDRVFSSEQFLMAFANGSQYGNGIVIAPEADPADGWLDAVIVAGGAPLRQFWRARRLGWRPLHPAEGVIRARVRQATISADRLECHVDGETFEASGSVAVSIEPGALRIARPSPTTPPRDSGRSVRSRR